MLYRPFTDSYKNCEVVIGLVYPIGTDYLRVTSELTNKFRAYGYDVETIQVSNEIISAYSPIKYSNEFDRIQKFMDAGNRMRDRHDDNGILALGVADVIYRKRVRKESGPEPLGRKLFIINSLKNPEEVRRLREIYEDGFYLIAIDESERKRLEYLAKKDVNKDDGKLLIDRDQDEKLGHGQNTRDTFQSSDFFVSLTESADKTKADVDRIVNLIFGHPHLTPTFDEFAMYNAFVASLRSADLSRQVGAVIAKDDEILATGSNDCPRFGGGLYWPISGESVVDKKDGRDYTRGFDSNKAETAALIEEILSALNIKRNKPTARNQILKTRIKDITEYGRVVHAEMEALLYCARNNVSAKGATLYATTFPCHNCAKHIIAAGIHKVIYVEPYPKSKAFTFYNDSITSGDGNDKVRFKPFIGVGPRKFLNFFSLRLGSGVETVRKTSDGRAVDWASSPKNVRMRMLPLSYIEKEELASKVFKGESTKKGDPYGAKREGAKAISTKKWRRSPDSKLAAMETDNRSRDRKRVQKK